MSAIFRTLQRQAHQSPEIFYAICIGAVGPIMVFTVPSIRRSMGWQPAERVPTTYPIPDRPRRPTQGFEDS